MESAKILVIGSLNMDWIIKISHTPVAGETIMGQFIEEVPGGKGGNQAYTASSLGGNVTMLGCIGNDLTGQKLINSLQKSGVKTSSINIQPESQSGMALIYINDAGNNSIVVLPNANNTVSKEMIHAHQNLIEEAEIILLQMEIPHESVYETVQIAHALHKTIILNPAPAPSFIPDEILCQIDYLTPNETELEILSGCSIKSIEDAHQAARLLIKKGVKNVIVTLGSHGALLVNTLETTHFAGHLVHAIDTTAAGDSFNGAIAVCLAEGKSIYEAIAFANRVASITVTRSGAQSSIPYRHEV